MRAQPGFTLIEILIVISIISITLGFALMAFGDFGESRRLFFAAQQLANTIELAQQQAILENSSMSLQISKNGYQLCRLPKSKQTKRIIMNKIFKMHYFPKNTVIRLTGTEDGNVIINSSADMTAFILHLGTKKEPNSVTLIGKHNGNLVLSSGAT